MRTVAGSGSQSTDKEGGRFGTEQDLASPWDVCLVSSPLNFLTNPEAEAADVLLIANAGTHQIWALALQDVTWWKNVPLKAGQCIRIAGSGAEENRNNSYPTKAAFAQPSGICCALISPAANKDRERYLYIADSESSSIRQMSLKDGAVKAVVGGDRDPMVNLFIHHFISKSYRMESFLLIFLELVSIRRPGQCRRSESHCSPAAPPSSCLERQQPTFVRGRFVQSQDQNSRSTNQSYGHFPR